MDKSTEPPAPGRAGVPGPAWGPDRWISSATLAAMLGGLAWRLLDHDPEDRVVAATVVVVCAVVTLLLVRIRVRLRVVPGGIAVTGPLRTRRIDWAEIDTISTRRRGRRRRGGSTLELEIRPPAGSGAGGLARLGPGDPARIGSDGADLPDDELLTFGRFDLGADPEEVGAALRRLRR